MRTASSEPANAATGTADTPAKRTVQLNVMAVIAPSAAPVETPSVKGVASGLRSKPWKTTPAAANNPPTHAPASVRGSRATKKICASELSANGTEKSKTRRRWIVVGPTSGAARIVTSASAPKPNTVRANRRCSVTASPSCRVPANRNDHPRGRFGTDDGNIDVEDGADVVRRQDVVGGPGRHHRAVANQDETIAERSGEREIVRRDDDRHAALPAEGPQQVGD